MASLMLQSYDPIGRSNGDARGCEQCLGGLAVAVPRSTFGAVPGVDGCSRRQRSQAAQVNLFLVCAKTPRARRSGNFSLRAEGRSAKLVQLLNRRPGYCDNEMLAKGLVALLAACTGERLPLFGL